MYNQHTCLNCNKPITYRFAICSECEKEFGNKATEWPPWLRFMWNDIQRERRRNKKVRSREISMVDIDKDEEYDN